VRVLPVSDKFLEGARAVAQRMQQAGLRAQVDSRNEKLGAKIRDGELAKVPVLAIVGAKELEQGTVAVRLRHRGDLGPHPLPLVIERLAAAKKARSLELWEEH